MKTQANKTLTFNKKNIIELNDRELQGVKGGEITFSVIPPLGTGWLCGQILGNK